MVLEQVLVRLLWASRSGEVPSQITIPSESGAPFPLTLVISPAQNTEV